MANTRGLVSTFLLIAQFIFIVIFAVVVDYDAGHTGPTNKTSLVQKANNNYDQQLYPMFQDVHVMMLVGFGFLMTFLKRHGFGSVGFNFLLTTYIIQWSLLVNGWFESIGEDQSTIGLSLTSFLHADFAVAAILISFGAVLGVASPVQLLVMGTIEVVFYNLSIYLTGQFKLTDVGGSIVIHAFGAYFGLAAALVMGRVSPYKSEKEGSVYHSDLFAVIGTVFLWLFWPSFNAGPAAGNERHRAVINTIMSLSSCTTVTFAMSALVNKNNKFDMVHIQNAAIAGGVAMGASADLLVQPFGALIIGAVAAIVSVLGYAYLQPVLESKLGLHDTCGVHNLHGMPGILGAVFSAIFVALASEETYQDSFGKFVQQESAGQQAASQIWSLLVCLVVALVSGALTGLVMSLPIWDRLDSDELYEDSVFWECDAGDEVEKIEDEANKVPLQTISA